MKVTHLEDIIVWPDGMWCYREELLEMNCYSDDYYVLLFDTPKWHKFLSGFEQNRQEQEELLNDVYKREAD